MLPVNVIYDNRHDEDYERILTEFYQQGITDFKFWEAVIDKTSVVSSISASFKMIVNWAKENDLPEVCIAEQDLFFTSNNGWQYFLDNKPEQFDIYIGGNYLKDNRIEVKKGVIKVPAYVGNQLIVISKRYYDTFLSVPDNEHIDCAQNNLGEFYMCYPMPALQRPGLSFNHKGELINYNVILSQEDIYQ